jgi:hypothetical protein
MRDKLWPDASAAIANTTLPTCRYTDFVTAGKQLAAELRVS